MKKLILFISLLICTISAFSQQSIRAYDVESFKRLEAKRAFVLGGDSVYATTKMIPEDTTVVTELYLQAQIDSASIAMQDPDSVGQFPVWNPDSGFFIMDNVYNYATQTDLQNLEHSSTNNLGWITSGHTSSSNKIAAFDATGAATTLDTITNLASQYDLTSKVTGPASSTDNAIARFDGTTGKLIQNSAVTISDAGAIVTPSTIQATTGLFTNLSGNSVPYASSGGLANSIVRQTSVAIMTLQGTTTGGWYINGGNSTGTGGGYTMYQTDATNKFIVGTETATLGGTSGGGIAYVYGNFPFKVHTNGANRLTIDANGGTFTGYVQGTTGKFINLTDNYLIKHTSDATGLENSNIFFSGNIARYGTANTFSNDRDIVDKAYVDAIASGNMPKLPVDAATTGNITLSGTQTIDGYSAGVGARILVWKQTTASQNGVYIVDSGAWTRATDLDTWAELYKAYVTVLNGAQSGSSFVCTVPSTGTLGTDPVTWILYNAPTNITVSSPLAKSGNNINLGYDTNTLDVASNNLKVKDNVYQPLLNGTGFVKASGTTITYDNSTYLTTETDPIFASDSAKILHWLDTLNLTKGIASQYDLITGLATKQNTLTTGNLTENITGLQFDNTRQVIGGSAQLSLTSGYFIPTTTEQTNWNTAYTDRNKWDGGTTGLVASTGRTSLGGTTIGQNVFTSTNPSAIRFLRANADNTVSWLDAATFRTAIGAGTGGGSVTSVAMTVPTGLTVTGSPITTSGTLALSLTSGYSIPTTANQTNWTAGYNDKVNSLAFSGTTTKTLTLTQQDGGTVSNTFTDLDVQTLTVDSTSTTIGLTASGSNSRVHFNVDKSATNELQNLSLGTVTTTTQPLNISNGSGVTLPAATTSAAGLLTSADKTKLDGIATGANNYVLPLAANGTRGGIQIGYTATGANLPLQLSSEKGYVSLTNSAIVSGLGFTPYNATNPAGYTTNTGTVTSVGSGLGLTGGSITTSGTLAVDTASSVILSRQRAANTYQSKGSYLSLTGGTMTGTITLPASTVQTAVTGLTTAPLYQNLINTGTGGFAPFLHGRTTITGGYVKHINIGAYRSGTGWNGGIYFAQGGNDANPTEYFLMGFGGNLTHSSGSTFYNSSNSNLSTVDWATKNLSVNGTATGTQDATLSNQFVRLGQLSSYLPTSRNLTINGTTYDLSSDRTWNVGTVTSVATGLGLSGGTIATTGTIALDTASTVVLSRQRAVNTYQPKGNYQTGTESYISNLSLSGNTLTSTGFGSAFNSTVGNIANTTSANVFNQSQTVTSTSSVNGFRVQDAGSLIMSSVGTDYGLFYMRDGHPYFVNGDFGSSEIQLDAASGTVTSVGLTVPTGFSVTGSPVTTSGTLGLTFASGYSIPTTANQTNWTAGYNDKVNSLSISGTTTKTITLTQQDGGTVTGNFTDNDTYTSLVSNGGLGASGSSLYLSNINASGTAPLLTDYMWASPSSSTTVKSFTLQTLKDLIGTSSYSLPLAANGTRGGIQIGYTSTANNFALQLSSEKAYTALPDATTSVKGIASFNSSNFSLSSGAVSIATSGVGAMNLANSVISGQVDIGSDIVDTDEFLISDAGTLRRTDASRLKTYIGSNNTDLSFSGTGPVTLASSTGQDVTITGSGNISVSASSATNMNITYADGDPLVGNEYNTSMSWNDATNTIGVVDGGGTKSATITGFVETSYPDLSIATVVSGSFGSSSVTLNGSVGTNYYYAGANLANCTLTINNINASGKSVTKGTLVLYHQSADSDSYTLTIYGNTDGSGNDLLARTVAGSGQIDLTTAVTGFHIIKWEYINGVLFAKYDGLMK